MVLYSCSRTCGVFLELLTSLETNYFSKSLRHFIAKRARPSKIYSDSGKTFVAAAKSLKKAQKDEKFHVFVQPLNHLAVQPQPRALVRQSV